jgi:hypothetical protein
MMTNNFELPYTELPKDQPQTGQSFKNLKEIKVGKAQMAVDNDGMYLGADKFSEAPFRVDYDGNMTATAGTFSGGGTFSGALSGATGTFTGSLSAATGSFAGSLSAATGTFIGDLSGNTITGAIIKNQSGTVVIDSTGLNSTTNFAGVEISSGATGSTASGSYVDVSGSQMNSFTLSRATNVYVYSTFAARNDEIATNSPRGFYERIYDINTGAEVAFSYGTGVFTPLADYYQGVYYGKIIQLAAGTHTFKLQYHVVGGGNAQWSFFNLGYIILGN